MSDNFYTMKWDKDALLLLNQPKLPNKEEYVSCSTYKDVAVAIETMVVRGAPAIGVAAAYGIALGVLKSKSNETESMEKDFKEVCDIIARTRPTAVNLFWAVERMKKTFNENKKYNSLEALKNILIEEAHKIYNEDIEINKSIGRYGKELIKDGMNILTHCNAGALASAGFGMALGVVRAAFQEGKKIHVYSDETRPFLQGARLTMWELMKDKIPCTMLTDNMSAYLMSQGKVDIIIVGADRIAANGDTANKIGTYALSILAKYHKIPFYIAAPLSTIDLNCPDKSGIPIEQRAANEVKIVNGAYICPETASVINPGFDVTPSELITGIITNKGIVRAPFSEGLKKLFEKKTRSEE